MSKRNEKLLLEDIVDCASNIFEYTTDMSFEEFINDQKTIDAVIKKF